MRCVSIFGRMKTLSAVCLLGVATCTIGCSEREVLDVETPAGEVEVNEDIDTGELDVDVDDNDADLAE